jgi:hypothetical protein
MRDLQKGEIHNTADLAALGLDQTMLTGAIDYTYRLLDSLDSTLTTAGEPRLAGLLELANLSAIVGNLFRGGLARASGGRFEANGPHRYPDVISKDSRFKDLEIKVSLETNSPKGHLIKPGPHLTVRYVLGDEKGICVRGKSNRGSVIWIWEVRVGVLTDQHFTVSNTAGDSGKTAVVNALGMDALKVVFLDLQRCPHGINGTNYKKLAALKPQNLELFGDSFRQNPS